MPEELPSTLIVWEDVYRLCGQLAEQLRTSKFRIDIIVAIGRGGYVPGRILSDMLGIADMTGFKVEHYQGTRRRQKAFVKYPLNADINGKNVLLLDDVCDSGDTFGVGIEHVRRCGAVKELRTAVLHFKTVSGFVPDFYVELIRDWRWLIYPWAVNEDLSSMIAKMRLTDPAIPLLQRLLKERHGIDVTCRQVEDALKLVEAAKKTQPEFQDPANLKA